MKNMVNDYFIWKKYRFMPKKYRDEILSMNADQVKESFGSLIDFGTGGMRGIMGAGTNRINDFTIRWAANGLALYLLNKYQKSIKVIIAYDTRHDSLRFARISGRTLAANGIKAVLFKQPRPTPELSFAVRQLQAQAGIVITASHNPPIYNGFKIYDDQGCQFVPHLAEQVRSIMNEHRDYFKNKLPSYTKAKHDELITELGVSFDRIYLRFLKSITLRELPKNGFKIVYTPLYGTGLAFGATLLRKLGYEVHEVGEQMIMDPDFTTVSSPNPEDKKAFTLAERLGKSIGAQLLLATDPDADRLGLAILNGHEYKYLSGATIGALLLDYIIQHQKELTNRVVITTIVTSPLGASIAKYYGLKVIETLTGFKFIGEQIAKLENQQHFLFGYEESFGYLLSPEVRDKDAFQAMVIAAEMANHYYQRGISIDNLLQSIYLKYGYYKDSLLTFAASGQAGLEKIKLLMESLRKTDKALLDMYEPLNIEDYEASIRIHRDGTVEQLTLPKSDVLKWNFKQGFVVFRPSGTEPKLKVYISIGAPSEMETDDCIAGLKMTIESFVRKMIYD